MKKSVLIGKKSVNGNEMRFKEECNEIAKFCEEQGIPTYGSTYELMVEEARAFYLGNDGSNK